MAKVGFMMREHNEKYQLLSADFDVRACVHELALMANDARLSWLTGAPEEQLTELAEYFVDRLRAADWMQRLREAQTPDFGTIFNRFHNADTCRTALERAHITLVFTSHPSELRPPAVLAALADVAVESTDEQVRVALHDAGQRLRTVRPLVTDEIDGMIARADRTIFDGLRDHILRIRAAWTKAFGAPQELLPLSIRLHTWVGADRDGNPSVTASTTLQAGLRFHGLARDTYMRWLLEAHNAINADFTLQADIAKICAGLRETGTMSSELGARLEALFTRARAGGEDRAEAVLYATAVVYRSLGPHLLALEWRENSAVIMQADAETARGAQLESEDLSPAVRDLLASLCALAELRREHGPGAVQALIISNCEDVAVMLALQRLARACGVFDTGELHIVPLLESIDALRQAPEMIRQLFGARFFEDEGSSRRFCQVMLGYSDAAKDGGRLMADECIRQVQRELADVCATYGVTPYVFHGRGGTPARGQATIAESFADLQPALPLALLKQTEQGEVVANRYGHTVLAAQTFDTWLFDALDQQLHDGQPENDEFRILVERLAQDAFIAYRALRNDPNFLAHLMAVTPLLTVCRMPLGSRPAARVEANSTIPFTLARLRAIPLNLAANVAHVQMPAWYGTGRALAHEIGAHGSHQLRQAYHEYAPLRSSLNRAARALAATEFSYVRERADLSGSDQISAFVADLEAEAERLKAGLLLVGIPIPKRTVRDDTALVFRDFQRALYRRSRMDRDVPFDVDALAVAAAAAEIGMSG